MKKIIVIYILILSVVLPIKVCAATDYQEKIDDIADSYNISVDDLKNADLNDVAKYIINQLNQSITEPYKLSVQIIIIIVLFAAVKALASDDNSTAINTADNICTLIVFIVLLEPVQNIGQIVTDNLVSLKNFMISFLPVYAGISISSGEYFTSTVYSGFFLTSMAAISNFIHNTILPSLNLYFALIISDILSPFIRLKSISDFYVKSVRWIMKSIVSLVCFILTVQTTISQGKDTLAVKAGKFITGTAVPVIGSALQDAVGSIYASMEAIKGFAGAVGIIGIAGIFLPSVIALAAYWLCTNCLFIVSDVFEIKSISGCIKGYITIIELMLSVVFLYMVMLLFSLTIMISITNGV